MNLDKPIVFFDLETTGTNVVTDRIVEIGVVKLMPDGERIIKTRRCNPGIPIPEEATAIHGITNEDVENEPPFSAFAKGLNDFFIGCDLGGYNILEFDIPVLAEELLRCDITPSFDHPHVRIVDNCKIFKKKEERTLKKALEFYCEEKLENAHCAEDDILATVKVFEGQMKKYEDLSGGVANFHDFCFDGVKMYDLSGKIGINSKGDYIFLFGQHEGKKVKDNLSYVEWILKSNFSRDTKDKLRLITG